MTGATLVERFRAARRDPDLAVVEGFHSIKHAVRFGAEFAELVAVDPTAARSMAERYAEDVADRLGEIERVPREVFDELVPHPPPTGVVGVARRTSTSPEDVVAIPDPAPVVLLENPARLGNLGAAIRVSAAAGAAGLVTVGELDPWHPEAIRGAAGLQFAIPLARAERPPVGDRLLVAVDPAGEPMTPDAIPPRAVLAFGTERRGLSEELRGTAERRIGIPMRPGVSSLNLATSVAVILYTWRLEVSSGR